MAICNTSIPTPTTLCNRSSPHMTLQRGPPIWGKNKSCHPQVGFVQIKACFRTPSIIWSPYTERERERDIYIYIYVYVCIHIPNRGHNWVNLMGPFWRPPHPSTLNSTCPHVNLTQPCWRRPRSQKLLSPKPRTLNPKPYMNLKT